MMRNDTITFRKSAVRFRFRCIAASVNPASVCLRADLRRRPLADGRSKLTRDDFLPAGACWSRASLLPRGARRRDNSTAVGSFIAFSGTSKEND
jgi:hypothetical protein